MTTVSVGQQVSCRVLGSLELAVDGVPVVLGGVLVRRLLAALVLAEGRAVPDDELMELLWPGDQPAKGLRVVVWRMRTSLGVAAERLERTASGYRFALDAEATDQHRFASLVVSGLELLAAGDAADALPELSGALRLWRGEPWLELGDSTAVIGARARLTELHELAREELQAAHLASGNPLAAVRSLTQLVADSPYRERRWELLARALSEAGHPERAAAELQRYRRLLADHLGLDPGSTLVALERSLIARPAVGFRRPAWRWR